ncbi:low affinity iron permease family protein [Stenotrophomonas sp. HITSZ_GD]|uniref:low affinity iron permease family protein n=1 Tax=Stenotrophomonas sp. HITSZ_GD TaxID=3037248 RepID=UPI00240E5EEB|nr:low affinity iron permease family protein [Stenotrophomonas sp. HITSZ_GD]MDG2523834.1 low affinity iron permease family protein [Stenotrophomonas sp. HITSZ_GD]
MSIRKLFNSLAKKASTAAGSPWVFAGALGIVVVWGISGPVFGFNDTWQLVINTGTTIITFLMVFLIQHTQNADTAALHLKLDELIRATHAADNLLLNMEELDEKQLERIRHRYEQLAAKARERDGRGRSIASPCRDEELQRDEPPPGG